MRRRILTAMLAVTTVALVAFGVPLAVGVRRLYTDQTLAELERAAAGPARNVPVVSPLPADTEELPESAEETVLGLYDQVGRTRGGGPPDPDGAVRTALRGKVATVHDGGQLVAAVPVSDGDRVVGAVRAAVPIRFVNARIRRTWVTLGVLAAIALGAATTIAILLARRLSRPVIALADVADRLGEGDIAAAPAPSGVPEVDELRAVLDRAGRRVRRVLDRERAFSADASHQLRTPLAGLRLRLETAQLVPGVDRDDTITAALVDVDRLEATIDELLALARDLPDDRTTLDVAAVIESVRERWHPTAAEQSRRLATRVEPDLPPVALSSSAVDHILDVLVSNALRHARGRITIAGRAAVGGVAIDVSDEGPGITGDPDAVFRRREGDGTGIGLAFARSVADAEGARLRVRTAADASVFTLLIAQTAQTAQAEGDDPA